MFGSQIRGSLGGSKPKPNSVVLGVPKQGVSHILSPMTLSQPRVKENPLNNSSAKARMCLVVKTKARMKKCLAQRGCLQNRINWLQTMAQNWAPKSAKNCNGKDFGSHTRVIDCFLSWGARACQHRYCNAILEQTHKCTHACVLFFWLAPCLSFEDLEVASYMFDLFAQAETTKGHYGYLMLSVATRGGDCCWRDRNKADERFLLSGSAFAFPIPTHPWLNQTAPINLPKQSLPNSWRWRSHGPLTIFGHNSWVNLLVHGRWQPWKV